MKSKIGLLSILLAAVVFSTFGILIRELHNSFGTFTQVSVRVFVAAFLLLVWIIYSKTNLKIKNVNRYKLILFFLAFPLSIIFFTQSVIHGKAANAVFYLYATSFITSFFVGRFFFKEKTTPLKLSAVFLAFIGLIIFSQPIDVAFFSLGTITGILSGAFDALANTSRKLLGHLSRNVLLFYQYFTGALLALSLAIFSGEKMIIAISPLTIITAIAYGLALILIGRLLLYGFSHFDLNLGTVVLSSELFFALLLNFLFLHESPTLNELVGGVLIFSAIGLINLEKN